MRRQVSHTPPGLIPFDRWRGGAAGVEVEVSVLQTAATSSFTWQQEKIYIYSLPEDLCVETFLFLIIFTAQRGEKTTRSVLERPMARRCGLCK